MLRQVLTAIVGLALLVACESTAVSGEKPTMDQLTQNDWAAETINGAPVINPGRVTLSFGDGRVSGRGGCNLYSGPAEVGGGTLKFGPMISTKMACMEQGLMQQEVTYLKALQDARRYAVGADGKLTISTSSSGDIVYGPTPRQVRPEN
jgi:heat shock protein HslJ